MVPWRKSFMQIPIDIRYHIFQPVKSSYSRSFRIIMSSQIIKLSFDEKNPIKTVRNLQVDFSRQIRQGWQLDIYIYEKLQSKQEENLFKNRSWWSMEPNIFRMLFSIKIKKLWCCKPPVPLVGLTTRSLHEILIFFTENTFERYTYLVPWMLNLRSFK